MQMDTTSEHDIQSSIKTDSLTTLRTRVRHGYSAAAISKIREAVPAKDNVHVVEYELYLLEGASSDIDVCLGSVRAQVYSHATS